jgi:GNAT superfamily N-acetyltransferase
MMKKAADGIKIISYQERYAPDFIRLNQVWLANSDLIEDGDAKHLNDPRKSIIDPGGQIFFAVEEEVVLGTCAAIRKSGQSVEIAKLAVEPSVQRHGVGRLLTEAVIEYSRDAGARKIYLVSNTKLKSALRLYESMGFVHAPLPQKLDYASADVYMELMLSDATSSDFLI